jgi:homoserine O-succinyltransferase/O-acetyltransferase
MDQMLPDGTATIPTSAPIVIGLVNNMPGEARRHTEQQFRAILSAAVRDVPVELRFFSFEAHPGRRADAAGAHYEATQALDAAAPDGLPDGLIVTGAPPRTASLADEPYWPKLTRLIDVVQRTSTPTVWSCLAAHAAVLYLDGIERQRLPQKLSGLVACARVEAEHPLLGGLPWQWRIPHSRYNDLPEAALRARGYRMLSSAGAAGADIFVRDGRAPMLFCQGHPEYDAHALLREYRRDARQFLAGERADYPQAPENYFGPEATALLEAFRARAVRERRVELMEAFPMAACVDELRHSWQDVAVGLYANWLAQLAERRQGGAVPAPAAHAAVAVG